MKFQGFTKVLLVILALSLFFRVVNLQNNLHFTGDEGRDALVALNIVNGREFPVLGPGSSIGEVNLGPLYYYLIAPFSLLGRDPVYLVIPVILFSVLTSALLYFVVLEIFKNKTAATLSALFYAIYPLTVTFGRFSWNPNIMPFFSLLYFYSLWKTTKPKNNKWLLVMALSFGVMIQSHYVSLVVIPISIIYFWIKKVNLLCDRKTLALAILIVAAMLSPLIFYDVSRNFRNLKGIFSVAGAGGFKLEAHYLEFLWPLAFIALSLALIQFIRKKPAAGFFATAVLSAVMIGKSLLIVISDKEPSVSGIKEVAALVEEQSQGKAFNFAVLSSVNREDSYRYFFTLDGAPARYDVSSEQLFVVCEDMAECDPQGHPKYEIAIFDVAYNGQVKITQAWNIRDYYKVVKLTPDKNL